MAVVVLPNVVGVLLFIKVDFVALLSHRDRFWQKKGT
jgi:hypothetical protein